MITNIIAVPTKHRQLFSNGYEISTFSDPKSSILPKNLGYGQYIAFDIVNVTSFIYIIGLFLRGESNMQFPMELHRTSGDDSLICYNC